MRQTDRSVAVIFFLLIQGKYWQIASFQNQRSYMVVNAGPSSNRQIQNQQFANEISTLFERCYIKGQDQKWRN